MLSALKRLERCIDRKLKTGKNINFFDLSLPSTGALESNRNEDGKRRKIE